MNKIIDCTLSKSGLPCLWEEGGGTENAGRCAIISDNRGLPKKAIYIDSDEDDIYNSGHALIPVSIGDIYFDASLINNNINISINMITEINGEEATLKEIDNYCNGYWNDKKYSKYENAISVAVNKVKTYHCQKAMYVLNEK